MRRILLAMMLLLVVAGCASTPTGRPPSVWSTDCRTGDPGCAARPPVPPNLTSSAGPSGKVSIQGLLVQRGSQVYPLFLYLVQRQDGSKVLVDPIGQTYTGLADFREHNTLLTPDDRISAPSDVMTAGSAGTISTTGHVMPSTPWWPWLVGGVALVVVAALVVWFALSRRRTAPEQRPEQ